MNIDEMLKFDPLSAAEELTGESYKTDEFTEILGLSLHLSHNQAKQEAPLSLGDTTFSNKLDRYLFIVQDLGFELAKKWDFIGPGFRSEDEDRHEQEFLFIQRELGIVLHFDTYGGDSVNSAGFNYCWRPNPGVEYWGITSSGGMESEAGPGWQRDPRYRDVNPTDLYYSGHHDAREALRHKINMLKEHGTFLPKWPAASHGRRMSMFTLTNYADHTKVPKFRPGYDEFWEGTFLAKYNSLPDWAKEVIGEPCLRR
jgi:hypothetical protein